MWLDKASAFIHQVIDPVIIWLANLSRYALVTMVLVVIADVIMRVMKLGVTGLSELQVFLMVVITFFSLSFVGMKRQHIRVAIFVEKLSPKHQAVLSAIGDILALVIMVLIAWQSIPYALHNMSKYTALLHMPLPVAIFMVTVGTGLLSIILLADLFEHLGQVRKNYHGAGIASKFLVTLIIAAVPLVIYTIPLWLHLVPWGIPPGIVGIIGFAFMLLLMFLGLPIAYSMILIGFIGVHYLSSWPAALMVTQITPYITVANYLFLVIPFFILMGILCAIPGGISASLFNTAYKWMGKLPGGLAIAAVGGCAAFGAVCGDTLATVATMGKVAFPEMRKHKYDNALATGCIAAGGTLGIMIPPSVVFIIYGIIAEQSVGQLLVAGIFPGILTGLLMMTAIYFQVRRNPSLAPIPPTRVTFIEKLVSLRGIIDMLILFILVIGGIYSGIFTPVEAGAIGAAGAFVIGLARRFMTRRALADALLESAAIDGMILMILFAVGFLQTFLAQSRLPIALGDYVVAIGLSRWIVFLFIAVLYLVLGCIMNIIPAIMLTLPIIMPTVEAVGFNPIWFGVITVLLVMMGQITPPVGVACFVTHSMFPEVPLTTVFRGTYPLLGCMILMLVILAIFPKIALFLPGLMYAVP